MKSMEWYGVWFTAGVLILGGSSSVQAGNVSACSMEQRAKGIQKIVLKAQSDDQNESALQQSVRVVAYCVLPGARHRFVITSDAQLIEVTQSGETAVVGIVTAPTSEEYLGMIQTEKLIIGITGSGHLVNTETGAVVGAIVAVK